MFAGQFVGLLLGIIPAVGEEAQPAPARPFQVDGGVGIVMLEADEIVFLGEGSRTELSHLFWNSVAPAISGGIWAELPHGWTVAVKGQVALSGDSSMKDYDWINPPGENYDFDNWTDISQHDHTNLDWYFNGSVLVGHDIPVSDKVTFNLNGGFKYVDVRWSSFGGSHVYSTDSPGSFRDDIGASPDGRPAIRYRQQFPTALIGVDTDIRHDRWTFDLGAQGGLSFSARASDNHWQRDLLFLDDFETAPMINVSAGASYALAGSVDLFVKGSFDKLFRARGDETAYDGGGTLIESSVDNEGTGLLAASLQFGLKGHF
jgi:plasminogen activator